MSLAHSDYSGVLKMFGIKENRNFMKANWELRQNMESDQDKGVQQPPLQKPYDENGRIISLPEVSESVVKCNDFYKCLKDRKSIRKFSDDSMTMEELGFLLWATQGVTRVVENRATFRPVASAGARHPFETYLVITNVQGLENGVYRYLALSHQLLYLKPIENAEEELTAATLGQKFCGQGNVFFIWTCIPYRGEWRYDVVSHKAMLLDAGHICQNLYLACEAIEFGTCAIAAYNQDYVDKLIEVDGENEFSVYMAPVGKKTP